MEHDLSQPDPMGDTRRGVNMLMTIFDGVAWTGRIFVRYRIGSEQPGLAGLIGAIAILLTAGFGTPADPKVMLIYLGCFLGVCFIRRTAARRRESGPDAEHSFCQGYSYLQSCLPFLSDFIVESCLEPLLFFMAGGIVSATFSPLLGMYLWLVSLSLFFVSTARHSFQRRELRKMRDMYIEQRGRAQAFRHYLKRGGPWPQ